jgi:hypothetical protein
MKGRDYMRDINADVILRIFKSISEEEGWRVRIGSNSSEEDPVAGFCVHNNDYWGSLKEDILTR